MNTLISDLKSTLKEEKKPLAGFIETLQKELQSHRDLMAQVSARRLTPSKNDWSFNIVTFNKDFPFLIKILKHGSHLTNIIEIYNKLGVKLESDDYVLAGSTPKRTIYLDSKVVSEHFGIELRDDEDFFKCFKDSVELSGKRGVEKLCTMSKLQVIGKGLDTLITTMSAYEMNLGKMINSLDVEKIKPPFAELAFYLYYLSGSGLDDEGICNLLGNIIVAKAYYLKSNPDVKSLDREFVMRLSEFYNEDGSFKKNIDFYEFIAILSNLLISLERLFELFNSLLVLVDVMKDNFDENKYRISAEDFFVKICKCYLEMLKDKTDDKGYTPDLTVDLSKVNYGGISPEARQALDYIKQYYSNGELKSLPEDLEEFFKNLSRAPFDERERQSIRRLVEDKLAELNQLKLFEPLSAEQKQIFDNGSKVLDSLPNGHKDYGWLLQLLSECQAALELCMESDSSADKDEVLDEISSLLEQINSICNSLVDEKKETTNRYIFLLDRRGTPYVCSDNEEMDSVYKDRIVDLLKKIAPECEGRFNPVLGVNDANYKMYEVSSSKCHLAFVEVVTGIYVIIGSGVSDKAYDTFKARFRNHLKEIAAFESGIKDPNLRDKILTDHVSYYDLFMGDKTRGEAGSKRVINQPVVQKCRMSNL